MDYNKYKNSTLHSTLRLLNFYISHWLHYSIKKEIKAFINNFFGMTRKCFFQYFLIFNFPSVKNVPNISVGTLPSINNSIDSLWSIISTLQYLPTKYFTLESRILPLLNISKVLILIFYILLLFN